MTTHVVVTGGSGFLGQQVIAALLASPGSNNDDVVYRFSADVYADQTTEIDRMQKMLVTVPAGRP